MGGGAPDQKHGKYLGDWGNLGSQTQRGIITYGLSANRQKPLAGVVNAAIFNTYRRTKHQIWYWLPPMVLAYYSMQWASEKNEFLNSKHGRPTEGEE